LSNIIYLIEKLPINDFNFALFFSYNKVDQGKQQFLSFPLLFLNFPKPAIIEPTPLYNKDHLATSDWIIDKDNVKAHKN
jgi:hypothetical protein